MVDVRPEHDEHLVEVGYGRRVVAGGEVAADVPGELPQPVVLVHQPGDRGEVAAAAVVAHGAPPQRRGGRPTDAHRPGGVDRGDQRRDGQQRTDPGL